MKFSRILFFAVIIFMPGAIQAESNPRFRCPPPPRICIAFKGDSTAWGNTFFAPEDAVGYQAASATSKVLQLILRMQPRDYLKRLGGRDLRKATVINLAVAGTNTEDWARTTQNSAGFLNGQLVRLCDRVFTPAQLAGNPGLKLVRKACEEGGGMADHVEALVGRKPDVTLMTLGTNNFTRIDFSQTITDYIDIRDTLAPGRVLFSTPFRTENLPGLPNQDARQVFHDQLAGGLDFLSMLKGPNFGFFPFRTWDGIHPKEGSYAAAAGLWLESLRDLPY